VIARTTMVEIDPIRLSIGEAIELFRRSVVPALHEQEGFEGVYVLLTPEGKALVLTFWADETTAEAGLRSGFYAEQVEKFVTVFGAEPGRTTYDVVLADAPVLTAG
jgi:heme-degrading monooxygenase HmoA